MSKIKPLTREQAAVVGAYTGVAIGPVADIHQYAEKAVGYPVLTTHFADESFVSKLRTAIGLKAMEGLDRDQKAVIGAYTGAAIGPLGEIADYAALSLNRPVQADDLGDPDMQDRLRVASRADFLALAYRELEQPE